MSSLGNFVWQIADQLRGVYKPAKYGDVILPFTILRRLDCILATSREQVRALATEHRGGALDVQVKRATGLGFYNTSEYDFVRLLEDPEGLRSNLMDFVSSFSANVDVFERFKFENEIATLDEKNRLYLVVSKFAEVDLHPDRVPNAEMGDLFEELIRKFAEASNEEAGEHYTPRDAIRLMVDLLFAEEQEGLLEPGTVRSIYDPTAGTGGMLSVAEERLLERNPAARLRLYGQEINDQSYAICKSDMIAKGQDPSNIRLEDTLREDLFWDRTFDFCMSNPPYGVDWKAAEDHVRAEALVTGSRFSHGLPAVSDGQMLFLSHLAHKMRPAHEGGGRAGIVLNGSPLFNGGAGSGPSEIRRWLLESDLVDAIVALPTNMFFNTGIPTYVWILDNTKSAERKGKVQLINASSFWTKLPRNLGDKTRQIDDKARAEIVRVYDQFSESENSKIFGGLDFGYWSITIEQPLLDGSGVPILGGRGEPKPDTSKRCTETVPFTFGGNQDGDVARDEVLAAYFEAEVEPFAPGAWIDSSRTKVGYEIPFSRVFRQRPESFSIEAVTGSFREDESRAAHLAEEVLEFAKEFSSRAKTDNWPVVPLRRVAKVVNGGTPSPDSNNWEGPIYWATPVDINACDGFLRQTARTISEAGLASSRLVPAGSVLVSSRAPIGSVAVTEIDTAFNQGCKALVFDDNLLTATCLAFQLMASKGLMESLGQGTTFLEINAEKLSSIPVALPPQNFRGSCDFEQIISSFHHARRLFESLTDQARVRRRGMDMLIAHGAAGEFDGRP